MAPHGVGPGSEWHFAGFGGAMQFEPVENGLGLRSRRHMVAGKIAESVIVAQEHAAMALAVPQAGLGLEWNAAAALRECVTHMRDQRFTASTAVGSGFFLRRIPASGAHDDGTHESWTARSGIANKGAFNVGNAPCCQRDETGMKFDRIAFLASDAPEARKALSKLVARHGNADPAEANVVVVLGGDGHMLQTLHRFVSTGIPIYGMNRGSVGFLLNDYNDDKLMDRLAAAELTSIHPLKMLATDEAGKTHKGLAFNEVSLLRQRYQAAKLGIAVDGQTRLEELICDGVLLSTPAGSTAYNLSAHGPILPIDSPLLALTPISAFRPRGWRGAILPHEAKVTITVLEADKRPVAAVADHVEVRDVREVVIAEDRKRSAKILFDPGHSLAERVLREQFRF